MEKNKACTKCKKEKNIDDFHLDKYAKDGHCYKCKLCTNEINRAFKRNTYDQRKLVTKEWRERNQQKYKNNLIQWKLNNKHKLKIHNKKYYDNFCLFNSKYVLYLNDVEEYMKSLEKLLEVRCTYCGNWFTPTNGQVANRVNSIIRTAEGESRFYCNNLCKISCSIYNQKKYPKGFKVDSSREVLPELRKMCFIRDNYQCQKCLKTNADASLHCHHITPVISNPIEAADLDNCITLCKECHKSAHKDVGCRYTDLAKCKKDKYVK